MELGRGEFGPGPSTRATGSPARRADHLELDFSDDPKSPVAIKSPVATKSFVAIKSPGGCRFFGYFVPKGKSLTKITAFAAAGIALPVQKNAQTMVSEQKWPSPATTR